MYMLVCLCKQFCFISLSLYICIYISIELYTYNHIYVTIQTRVYGHMYISTSLNRGSL